MREAERHTTSKARALRKNMTDAEIILWSHLRRRQLGGYKFRRQVPIGPFIADFACVEAKLVVEVDGAAHVTDQEIQHDQRRTKVLNEQGWHVHRLWNDEIYRDINGSLESIGALLRDIGLGSA